MSSEENAREPTMEEILASIRRIISEEEAAAQTGQESNSDAPPTTIDFTEILELTNALPPAPAPAPAAALPKDIGLEALVRSLLEPHLKAWLDAHLPEIVEKMVAAEIARIAQKSPDQPA